MEIKREITKKKDNQLYDMIQYLQINIEYHPKEDHCINGIEITDDYTRIDFYYRSYEKYINGGWINIEPTSYIQPVGSDTKLKLTGVRNIPIAPVKHWFRRCGENFYYSLFFPAIPKSTTAINIVEMEKPGTYFNFYNVSVISKPINVNKELCAN
jgi:hypothetical protein